jgi:TRAP-type mannitol/chloroaromatic compound transport system permease small subunit
MSSALRQIASRIESGLDRLGAALSWVWLALIAVIVVAVVLRFVFGIGRIELEELQWHLYAIGFLFGIVGCATRDRHVRVDVIRERMSQRARDWVDLYGVLLFQIPLVILVLWSALPFVAESFGANEKSASAGGLPFRWILKSVLPISFALLGAASLARLIHVSRRLFVDEPTSRSPDSATPTSPAQ